MNGHLSLSNFQSLNKFEILQMLAIRLTSHQKKMKEHLFTLVE